MTDLKEIRVLVIEDNAGDFFLVQEYLSVATPRFTITRAAALKEALRILEQHSFDVILLDLSLPDSAGLRSVTAITVAASSIPLLVFTGFNEEQYGMDSLKLGAQDYLVKDEISSSLLIKSILYGIERSQVRKQIFRQERLFRIITENSIDAKFLLDDQGEITFCTPSVAAITGYTSNECIGQHQSYFIHPDDMPLFLTCIDMVKQDAKHYPVMEVRIRQKDSDYIWCRKTIVNLLQEEYVNAIVCTFWDISGEKESKEILEASEERYRYLFNNNPAVIVIWDPQSFEIAQVNLAAVQQYGYSRTEFLSKSVLDLRAPEDIHLIKELSAAALQDDQFKKTAVWRHLDKHGQEMFMQISSHSIVYNKKRSVLSIAINITEKLMLEKKLELERIEKDKQITQAVITAQENEREQIGRELHDNVAQLLASARLFVRLVKTGDEDSLAHIHETDKILTQSIDEIRKLSHALIPPTFHENELMQAIENIIRITTMAGKIRVVKRIASFDESRLCDQLRLTIYRIIQEQFNNIAKHAGANCITLTLQQEQDQVILSIADNGKGFDTTQKTSGVGLLNVKTRASLYNGQVAVYSSPGNGCEVVVCFDASGAAAKRAK